MSTRQWEVTAVVIERRGCPAILCVAIRAAEPVSSLVRLILLVAGIAVLKRHREVAQPTRVEVALVTGQSHMLPFDLERKSIVIEMGTEAIDAIMTIETRPAIRQ